MYTFVLQIITQLNPVTEGREAASLQMVCLPGMSHQAQSPLCRSTPSSQEEGRPSVQLGSVWISPAQQVRPQSRAGDVTPGETWVLQQEGEGSEVEE